MIKVGDIYISRNAVLHCEKYLIIVTFAGKQLINYRGDWILMVQVTHVLLGLQDFFIILRRCQMVNVGEIYIRNKRHRVCDPYLIIILDVRAKKIFYRYTHNGTTHDVIDTDIEDVRIHFRKVS